MPAPAAVTDHYDIIVIGTGPGGASLAGRLATTGRRILLIERGGYLPRSVDNWDPQLVFVDGIYRTTEQWQDQHGKAFRPELHHYVGGNSKVYGAALFRLRERDFDEVAHSGGISPAWPLSYSDYSPYYDEAERLYHVHGQRGEDPFEPPADGPYPYPPVRHEAQIANLNQALTDMGLQPYHIPLGILLDEDKHGARPDSPCIRCSRFDGFPCPTNGKADAQVVGIDPLLKHHTDTVRLLTGANVERLETGADGGRVERVHVTRAGAQEIYGADIVVVAGGALSSALLLLRSADDRHPDGLANGSGLVGRHYMRHNLSVLMGLLREQNSSVFQKTMAVSDYYFSAPDWDFPLGLVQMMARAYGAQIRGQVLPSFLSHLPDWPFEKLAAHALDFWVQSEDLPDPDNRIFYDGGRVVLSLTPNNMEAHERLIARWKQDLSEADVLTRLPGGGHLYFTQGIGIAGTAHQVGTCRFGSDPRSSVLDPDCRAHELDNLYVADGSFFPSIGAVNPTLTIVANALRVADRIRERL